jgi:arginyl-tRNA synthetase
MTTLTIAELEKLLARLGLKVPIPAFEAADILNKPLDIGRCYFADILRSLVNDDPEKKYTCEFKNAYSSILSPGDIFYGDLAVILPRLCHGSKADLLGVDLITRVRRLLIYCTD